MKRIVLLSIFAAFFTAMTSQASSPLYEIPVETIDGSETTLSQYEGKVLLIVNVASKCGYTKQYDGLESLYEKYKDQGLVVLGFPCNQFMGQEPGSNEEIAEFCRLTFGVNFPLFAKIEVNGDGRHELYEALAGESSPFPGDISWNFNKFLIDRSGQIIARYESKVEPLSEELVSELEAAL